MSFELHECDPCAPEILDGAGSEFFAPARSDLVDTLLAEYRASLARIESIAQLMQDAGNRGAIAYFLEGNGGSERRYQPQVEALFRVEGAVAKLNATYWQKALQLTDVYEAMPQKRRDEWNKALIEMSTPAFEEETVRSTLRDLLAMRAQFFAERIDGIFRGLSGEHVTNRPEGFSRRMIISYVINSYGTVDHSRAGLIADLRGVIAKFMGRDEPRYATASVLIAQMRRATGQWHTVDGGALRIRVYKKGTAHLEVHPDMAWRLNQVLAHLYPLAIPAEHRQRPTRRPKDFPLMQRPLPFEVLDLFASQLDQWRGTDPHVFRFGYTADSNSRALEEACRVLELLGGSPTRAGEYTFDYPVGSVLRQVVLTGCVPDEKAHQFYPTQERLARECEKRAQIGPEDEVLEPSAGRGGLAVVLPPERTTCVEIAALNCEVLRSRGLRTVQADFLTWAEQQHAAGWRVQRVVMNPPFADGRARLHVEAAARLLAPGGRLVAILPASMRGKDLLAGFSHDWSQPYDNEFAGTSVSVAILVLEPLGAG